jgi:two-component system phosphate regulon response regulator PhoB
VDERAVDSHIRRMRRKLGTARSLVQTVRGFGYRLADPGMPLSPT